MSLNYLTDETVRKEWMNINCKNIKCENLEVDNDFNEENKEMVFLTNVYSMPYAGDFRDDTNNDHLGNIIFDETELEAGILPVGVGRYKQTARLLDEANYNENIRPRKKKFGDELDALQLNNENAWAIQYNGDTSAEVKIDFECFIKSTRDDGTTLTDNAPPDNINIDVILSKYDADDLDNTVDIELIQNYQLNGQTSSISFTEHIKLQPQQLATVSFKLWRYTTFNDNRVIRLRNMSMSGEIVKESNA